LLLVSAGCVRLAIPALLASVLTLMLLLLVLQVWVGRRRAEDDWPEKEEVRLQPLVGNLCRFVNLLACCVDFRLVLQRMLR
jgi:hypothetical protein